MNRLRNIAPLLASSLLLLLATTACKNKDYPSCKRDRHCDKDLNEVCVDGGCQNCKVDTDCPALGDAYTTFVCHEFRCTDPSAVPAGGGGVGEEGDPCTQRTDCYGGLTCTAGSCSFCTEDTQCSPSTCNLGTGRCGPEGQCTMDDECAMDEICDGGMCIFSGDFPNEGEVLCDLHAVFFAFDSNKLTPQTQSALEGAATCLAQQGRNLILEAHADNVGTEEYNILLTDRRGNSVKSVLVGLGVAGETITVLSKGALEAVGSTESARSQDRRVQLIWE